MDDRQFAFGAPEEIIGVLGVKADAQRIAVGQADILAGKAHQPAQQVERLFPRHQHPCQPIERRIRIRPAQ